jgi:hypothetical protein
MRQFQCEECGKQAKAYGDRQDRARFCSRTCRDAWFLKNAKCRITCTVCGKRAINTNPGARFCSRKCESTGRRGSNAPNWLDVPRTKTCAHCGEEYGPGSGGITHFLRGKFCSRECSRKGQKRLFGESNPQYRVDARRKNRGGIYRQWQIAVISRDKATCQKCGRTGVEMHAHHKEPWRDHPELRFDVANGETLCCHCHWDEHSTSGANGVNSGEPVPGGAGGNPEPSHDRKVVEGVTTRGRAYRRIETNCEWCGTFVSKPLSDTKGKRHLFCSKSCSKKFFWASQRRLSRGDDGSGQQQLL